MFMELSKKTDPGKKRVARRAWRGGLGAALYVLLTIGGEASAHSFRIVVKSGDPAPGTTAQFRLLSLNAPSINGAGRVAFDAVLSWDVDSTSNRGIWSEGTGALELVARRGSQAPGTPEGTQFVFGDVPELVGREKILNDTGQVLFVDNLGYGGVTTSNDAGIWLGQQLVAREGDQAPGLPDGVTFRDLLPPQGHEVVLNDLGQVAFTSFLQGAGVTTYDHQGIWMGAPGALQLVARTRGEPPGVPGGAYGFLEPPLLNDAGQVAFVGRLRTGVMGGGVACSENEGVFSGFPGTLGLVAREGDHAPGTPDGVLFGDGRCQTGGTFAYPDMNNRGAVVFWAALTGPGVTDASNGGIWSNTSGPLELVAREGDQAPGTPAGANFQFGDTAVFPYLISDLQINGAGEIVFRGHLAIGSGGVTSANDQGIWAGRPGSLRLVAREGDPAPGLPEGVTFSGFWSASSNARGQVAIFGFVQGPGVDSSNDQGIWIYDPGLDQLTLLIRKGDSLEVSPGNFRTVNRIHVNTVHVQLGGGQDGKPSNFNDAGQLAFAVRVDIGDVLVVASVNQAPEAICKNVTTTTAPGTCSADADVDNASFDPDGVPITLAQSPAGPYPRGTTNVTLTVTAEDEASTSCTATVTVLDNAPPTITCPVPRTSECAGPDGTAVAYEDPTVEDNCPGALGTSCAPASGSPFALGSTSVSCEATDASGNTATCSTAVTVVDTTAPDLACPAPRTVSTSSQAGACSAQLAVAPTATDTCDGAIVPDCSPGLLSLSTPGSASSSCSATDRSGNSSSCVTTLTLVDDTPPAVLCPDPVIQECTGGGGATVTTAAMGTDNCAGSIPTSGPGTAFYALGTTPIGYSASDPSGNRAACSTSITVRDTTPPSISCPATITAECTSPAGAQLTPGAASASDICAGVTVSGPAAGIYPVGSTTVAYTAIDGVGLTASCSAAIQVVDTTPPRIACPAPQVVESTGPGGAIIPVSASASDICDATVAATCSPGSGLFSTGSTLVSCSATDVSGNMNTCSFTVTVLSPSQMTSNLLTSVTTLAFQQGSNLLQKALGEIDSGNTRTACRQLSAFINQVEAQSGKQLTGAAAGQLIASAERIKAALGCP